MSMSYTNKNTLFVTSKTLTLVGITLYLDQLLSNIKNYDVGYTINFPRNANHCYVWFNSWEVVNIIIGLNPDGSERVEITHIETDDPWYDEIVTKKLPRLIEIPDYENNPITLTRSYVFTDKNTNVILCKNTKGVPLVKIRNLFAKYTKEKITVKEVNTKMCEIHFPCGTTDALFAHQMLMYSNIDDKTLVFMMKRNK